MFRSRYEPFAVAPPRCAPIHLTVAAGFRGFALAARRATRVDLLLALRAE